MIDEPPRIQPTTTSMLLYEAAAKIDSLRRQNELQRARLDMFDSCMMLLTASHPQQLMGAEPDIVCSLRQTAETMERKAWEKRQPQERGYAKPASDEGE